MTEGTSQTPAAGWYPDPSGSGQLREWDGEQWTQQTRPAEQATSDLGAGYPGIQQPAQAAQSSRTPHAHSGQAGFFRSLFDLSFAAERSVTTGFVKVIYVVFITLLALGWLGTAVVLFIMGGIAMAATSVFPGGGTDGGMMIFAALWLVFGWIPGFINVIIVRVCLELVTAQIRTSQHTAELVRLGREAAQQRP